MREITFIKKNYGTEDELACQDCVFEDVCSQTEYKIPGIACESGDYWELKEEIK